MGCFQAPVKIGDLNYWIYACLKRWILAFTNRMIGEQDGSKHQNVSALDWPWDHQTPVEWPVLLVETKWVRGGG